MFTDLATINGFAQPSRATVLDARQGIASTYDVGRASTMQAAELDGQPGDELLFTNLSTINGFPVASQATIVSQRSRTAKTFDVGSPSTLRVADLDGQPGQEVVFTNMASPLGRPLAATATILTARTGSLSTYDVGNPLYMTVADLDGQPGAELAFVGIGSAVVITARTGSRDVYQVPSWMFYLVQEQNSDGVNDLVFVLSNGKTFVLDQKHKRTYLVNG